MRVRTVRWVAGSAAVVSVALIGGGLALAYVDRRLVPASLTGWTVSNISEQVVNAAVPVTAFVLASRRPENRIGWLFLVAGLGLGLGCLEPWRLLGRRTSTRRRIRNRGPTASNTAAESQS